MRTIVDAVDSEYGNARAWKLHWDRQLLKALGVAYRYSDNFAIIFDHNKMLRIYKASFNCMQFVNDILTG